MYTCIYTNIREISKMMPNDCASENQPSSNGSTIHAFRGHFGPPQLHQLF